MRTRPGVAHQQLEQLELLQGKAYQLVPEVDLVLLRVEAQAADLEGLPCLGHGSSEGGVRRSTARIRATSSRSR